MTNKPLIKKKIQKPFNIKEWQKSDAKVETKIGYPVKILCIDAQGREPIIGLIDWEDGSDIVGRWEPDGKYYKARFSNYDLVIIEETEEPDRWADDKNAKGDGWTISKAYDAGTHYYEGLLLNEKYNYDVFATEKQAKSALAMARISQLVAHDERYGGVVTDEEWEDDSEKYCIGKCNNRLHVFTERNYNFFLAFHTEEQCDLFLRENERLVKDYLMVE